MSPFGELNEDFADLLRCLRAEGVDFLVVGAYALAFHGLPRSTGDIDVLVRPSAENAERLWRALATFGAPLDASALEAADFARSGIVYQIGVPPRRVDVLTEISGLSFDEAWASREAAEFEGAPVCVLGRDALVKNKKATGRLKDLADVERLEGPDS